MQEKQGGTRQAANGSWQSSLIPDVRKALAVVGGSLGGGEGAGEFPQSHRETLTQSWHTLGRITRIGKLGGRCHADGFQGAVRTPGDGTLLSGSSIEARLSHGCPESEEQ